MLMLVKNYICMCHLSASIFLFERTNSLTFIYFLCYNGRYHFVICSCLSVRSLVLLFSGFIFLHMFIAAVIHVSDVSYIYIATELLLLYIFDIETSLYVRFECCFLYCLIVWYSN